MAKSEQKIFLTMDTDWCADEVLQYALDLLCEHDIAFTAFVTDRYAALENCDPARIEIGLHPNFNEAMPSQYEAKLHELLAHYPQAQGVSSHAMMSSTPLLELFRRCGLRYDRNLLFYKQAQARAFYHYNGLLRLPIFWEDDIWFSVEANTPFTPEPFAEENFQYVFNFHPIHLYLNTASTEHYAAFKPHYHEPRALRAHRYEGYGVLSYFMDLLAYLRENRIATGLLKEFLER